MAETKKYNNPQDYEKDLDSFLEADFIEEDVYENADATYEYVSGSSIDLGEPQNEDNENADGDGGDDDSYIYDIDFSEFKGKDFKSSLNKINRTVTKKKALSRSKNRNTKKVKAPKMPLSQDVGVKRKAILYGKQLSGGGEAKTTKRIIVPSTQKVIIQGVDKFILGKDESCSSAKKIGYYKCKPLKELVFIMNNNSAIDFNVQLFNPSEPLDYLYSTSGNINNKITVAGGIVSYTDVLFNILANPTHIVNAKFTFANSGSALQNQLNQPLIFTNKTIEGIQKVEPMNIQLQVDNMQVLNEIVFFDIYGNLARPFIPNGMDIIQYKVLAGSTVTFAFYYEQKDLRKFFYEEARNSKKLI
jgi:hypothetical protein